MKEKPYLLCVGHCCVQGWTKQHLCPGGDGALLCSLLRPTSCQTLLPTCSPLCTPHGPCFTFPFDSCFFQLVCVCTVTSVMSNSLRPYGLQPTRLVCPVGLSKQEYWSRLPCPPPGDLPDPGIKPTHLISPALEGGFFSTRATWEVLFQLTAHLNSLSPIVLQPCICWTKLIYSLVSRLC